MLEARSLGHTGARRPGDEEHPTEEPEKGQPESPVRVGGVGAGRGGMSLTAESSGQVKAEETRSWRVLVLSQQARSKEAEAARSDTSIGRGTGTSPGG